MKLFDRCMDRIIDLVGKHGNKMILAVIVAQLTLCYFSHAKETRKKAEQQRRDAQLAAIVADFQAWSDAQRAQNEENARRIKELNDVTEKIMRAKPESGGWKL